MAKLTRREWLRKNDRLPGRHKPMLSMPSMADLGEYYGRAGQVVSNPGRAVTSLPGVQSSMGALGRAFGGQPPMQSSVRPTEQPSMPPPMQAPMPPPRQATPQAGTPFRRRRLLELPAPAISSPAMLSSMDWLNSLRASGGLPHAQLTTPQGSAFRQHLTQNALRTGNMAGADIEGVSPAEFGAQSRLIQSTRGHNPARQMPRGPAPEPGTPGFGEGYYQGQSGVTVPGVGRRASNQSLGSGRVGTGFQSTGMNTGGAFGSSLMMGGGLRAAMGGVPQQPRQPAVDPYETAQGTRTRMLQSGQHPPSVIQLPDGTVRVIGSAGERQPEPNKDQLAKRAAYAAKLAGRQSAVEDRGIARGQARESRREFARDQQYFGQRGALVRAFQRSGEDPMRAMAMMGAMGGNNNAAQFLSEDNRQRRAEDEFRGRTDLERERLGMTRDQFEAERGFRERELSAGARAAQVAEIDSDVALRMQAIAAMPEGPEKIRLTNELNDYRRQQIASLGGGQQAMGDAGGGGMQQQPTGPQAPQLPMSQDTIGQDIEMIMNRPGLTPEQRAAELRKLGYTDDQIRTWSSQQYGPIADFVHDLMPLTGTAYGIPRWLPGGQRTRQRELDLRGLRDAYR